MFGKRVRQLRADHVAFHALHQVERRANHAGVVAKEQRPRHGHGSRCQRAHDPILALNIVRGRHQRTAWRPPQHPVRGAAIDEEGLVRVPAANALDLQRGVAVRQPLGKVTLRGLRIDQGRKSAHRCPSLLWRLARRRRCPVRARSLLATVYAARPARARPLLLQDARAVSTAEVAGSAEQRRGTVPRLSCRRAHTRKSQRASMRHLRSTHARIAIVTGEPVDLRAVAYPSGCSCPRLDGKTGLCVPGRTSARTTSLTWPDVRPYSPRKIAGAPCSTKMSGRPSVVRRTSRRSCACSSSPTALPKPPATAPSSIVTRQRVACASRRIISSSSGLAQRALTATPGRLSSSRSSFTAWSAAATMLP